jgi:hypothetical protein
MKASRPLLFSALVLSLSLFLAACKKHNCPDTPTYVHHFTAEDLVKYPYHNLDTLRFTKDDSDTLSFYGTNVEEADNEYDKPGGECKAETDIYPAKIIHFHSPDTSLSMGIELEITGDYTSIVLSLDQVYSTGTLGLEPPYAYDSLTVNNRLYRHISKIPVISVQDTAAFVLYCREEGIVRIKTARHQVWDVLGD